MAYEGWERELVTLGGGDGYTGELAAAAAGKHKVELSVVKVPEAKRRVMLPPRRWVVKRCFAWLTRYGWPRTMSG
jgi:hypothetical protein